jgi:protein-L-isoaspartate(D-aspartate) O-methyltransferase
VLEIGTGSGYMAALLSHRAQRVITLEIVPELAQTARENLQKAGIHNCEVRTADGSKDLSVDGPFDVIVLSGSVAHIPASLLAQLKPGGRLVAVVGEEPMMRATFITKPVQAAATDGTVTTQPWDTVAPRLLGFAENSKFSF